MKIRSFFLLLFQIVAVVNIHSVTCNQYIVRPAGRVLKPILVQKKKIKKTNKMIRAAGLFPFNKDIYELCAEQELLETQLKSYIPKEERHIVVIIPSYNNAKYFKQNLASVFGQDYKNFSVIYIDDASTDGTASLCEEYIKEMKQEYRTILVKNVKNQGPLANFYNAVHCCDSQSVIVNLDGDDSFAKPIVLSLLNKIYDKFQVFLTYGSYQDDEYAGVPGYNVGQVPQRIIEKRSYRKMPIFTMSHLRTFKAFLFQSIAKEDLMYEGAFFDSAGDLAWIYSMAEMAGARICYIPDILYLYNIMTPLSDFKIKKERQELCTQIIKQRPVYDVIFD